MWKDILVGIDNSIHSLWATDDAIKIARAFGAGVTGCHVYAVKLHDTRFKAMEYTLPERYLKDGEIEKQRDVHNLLIEKGMNVISDSYLDVAKKRCEEAEIGFTGLSLEGKNYLRLSEEGNKGGYELVILGALGVGATEKSIIGSVTIRSARRLRKDVLIVKDNRALRDGESVVVAMDGSPYAYAALNAGINLAKEFNLSLHAVAVYDPYFHYVMFNSISKVLSREGAEVFRFKEQEDLHEKIIDDGLKKIYESYLNVAKEIARREGVALETHLLAGKAYEEIDKYLKKENPAMLMLGRIGSHAEDEMDMGSNTENLLIRIRSNIFITSRALNPPDNLLLRETMKWTEEAVRLLDRVPSFARGMATGAIENYAREKGHTVVTFSVIKDALKEIMPAHLDKLNKKD